MSNPFRIQIGNQTAFSAASLWDPFHYALESGFEAFEWFPDKKPWGGWDENDLDASARHYIRMVARERGMRLSVHARWQANPLRPDAWPLLLRDCELARDLGAALVNIHLYTEAGLDAYAKALAPLLKVITEMRLLLAIENTPMTTPQDFNEFFSRLGDIDSVGAGRVGMCLDIGHANLCESTRHNYLSYVDQLAPELPITHLHLHENFGDYDSHLSLFTGPAAHDVSGVRGLVQRLRERGYSGAGILEQWPRPPWLLNQARDRLAEMMR
jgi:sugar phosphate isomerase/epimerase